MSLELPSHLACDVRSRQAVGSVILICHTIVSDLSTLDLVCATDHYPHLHPQWALRPPCPHALGQNWPNPPLQDICCISQWSYWPVPWWMGDGWIGKSPTPSNLRQDINQEGYESTSRRSHQHVLLLFYLSYCGSNNILEPHEIGKARSDIRLILTTHSITSEGRNPFQSKWWRADTSSSPLHMYTPFCPITDSSLPDSATP